VQTGPQSTRERKKSLLGVEDRATEAVSGKQRRLLATLAECNIVPGAGYRGCSAFDSRLLPG
jgi:hypothetical protein